MFTDIAVMYILWKIGAPSYLNLMVIISMFLKVMIFFSGALAKKTEEYDEMEDGSNDI